MGTPDVVQDTMMKSRNHDLPYRDPHREIKLMCWFTYKEGDKAVKMHFSNTLPDLIIEDEKRRINKQGVYAHHKMYTLDEGKDFLEALYVGFHEPIWKK